MPRQHINTVKSLPTPFLKGVDREFEVKYCPPPHGAPTEQIYINSMGAVVDSNGKEMVFLKGMRRWVPESELVTNPWLEAMAGMPGCLYDFRRSTATTKPAWQHPVTPKENEEMEFLAFSNGRGVYVPKSMLVPHPWLEAMDAKLECKFITESPDATDSESDDEDVEMEEDVGVVEEEEDEEMEVLILSNNRRLRVPKSRLVPNPVLEAMDAELERRYWSQDDEAALDGERSQPSIDSAYESDEAPWTWV